METAWKRFTVKSSKLKKKKEKGFNTENTEGAEGTERKNLHLGAEDQLDDLSVRVNSEDAPVARSVTRE